jgi:hypothetical protein
MIVSTNPWPAPKKKYGKAPWLSSGSYHDDKLEIHLHTSTVTQYWRLYEVSSLHNTHSLMEGRRGFRNQFWHHPSPQNDVVCQILQVVKASNYFTTRGNPQLTIQEKLDDILSCIHKYKWIFRDFIRHLVLENSRYNYAPRMTGLQCNGVHIPPTVPWIHHPCLRPLFPIFVYSCQ